MTTEFNEKVFRALSEKNQEKVEHIYNIADIIRTLKHPPLSVKDFDYLYELEIPELENISGYSKWLQEQKSVRV
jgi:hypothetical protein